MIELVQSAHDGALEGEVALPQAEHDRIARQLGGRPCDAPAFAGGDLLDGQQLGFAFAGYQALDGRDVAFSAAFADGSSALLFLRFVVRAGSSQAVAS